MSYDTSFPFTMPVQPAYSGGTSGNDMFGGNGAWWIIILFLFVFCGWGTGGWGNNGNGTSGGGAMEGYVLVSDFATLERKLDTVNSGLCDGFYAMAQQFSSLQNAMNQGFAGLNTAIMSQSNATNVAMMQGFAGVDKMICALQAQIADCCCDLQRSIDGLNYNIAQQDCETRNLIQNNTRDIIEAITAGNRSLHDYFTQSKMADMQSALNEYKTRALLGESNTYLVNTLRPCPIPAYPACNPYAPVEQNCGCRSC